MFYISRRSAVNTLVFAARLVAFFGPAQLTIGQNIPRHASPPVECSVYPAVPNEFNKRGQSDCRVFPKGKSVFLENGFISIEIGVSNAVIVAVENKLTNERYPIAADQTGVSFVKETGQKVEWIAKQDRAQQFQWEADSKDDARCQVVFSNQKDSEKFTLTYTLRKNQFWVERRLSVEGGKAKYDQLIYGAADLPNAKINELKLGKFDSPRLVKGGEAGIFCGVGWWFYEVKDGVYQNTGMDYATEARFEAEPWYVGIFQPEPGEPYPGWFWYKTFLSERKLAYDKRLSHVLWNARSGYSFQPINNPDLLNFVEAAKSIGLDGITTGEVRGLVGGTQLAATNATARKVIDAFAKNGVTFGLHEGDVKATNWQTDAGLEKKLKEVDAAAEQGIGNFTVDFLSITDRFADHRRVAQFFRHIREKMSYSECHLGMAAYGPQFQREVLINHPTDLHSFDIARFSSDWATLLGFRQSRRVWQERYQNLMPENGLFYFSTHYSNYPRNYQDPEPQQFLYIADAWRGLAYAFHDKFGFRDSVAAQAAFSTFYVFGFLDARIPKSDAEFAHDYLAWVKANSEVLNRSRVCFEDADALVMSKIQNGRGLIFALNYKPGQKTFKIKLELGSNQASNVRQIYPQRNKAFQLDAGKDFEFSIRGERLAIFAINDGVNGLPPENPNEFPIDVTGWQRTDQGFAASFVMTDLRANLSNKKDNSLPERIVSAEQIETEFLMTKKAGKSPGKLPRAFLDVYGFEDGKYLPTWKVVPWAFADRVWFVYVPENPPKIGVPEPSIIINGKKIPMTPRVRYNPRTKLANPDKWDAPMWFADVTEACKYGKTNSIVLVGINDEKPGACFVTSAVAPSNVN